MNSSPPRGVTAPSLFVVVTMAWATVGCGGSPAPATTGATWTDGLVLSAPVDIAAGTTVTIAPGAHVTVAGQAAVTIRGTLKVASAAGAHARLAPADEKTPWTGLVIDDGGTLDADGLDLDGAETAIDVRAGAAGARYDDGAITNALVPFDVERAGRLDTAHAKVVGATSSSGVNGEFHASYLDYDKGPFVGGFVVGDALAVFDVSDSTLHGTPETQATDYITTYGAMFVHVAYTTITGSHCAFHFSGVDRFEIDHVTTGASAPTATPDQNAWGAMLYGSGNGPNVIEDSNFLDLTQNLDQQGDNGPLTIKNTFTTGKNVRESGAWTLSPTEAAAAIVPDAMPR